MNINEEFVKLEQELCEAVANTEQLLADGRVMMEKLRDPQVIERVSALLWGALHCGDAKFDQTRIKQLTKDLLEEGVTVPEIRMLLTLLGANCSAKAGSIVMQAITNMARVYMAEEQNQAHVSSSTSRSS